MYTVGDKFIIEIGEEYYYKEPTETIEQINSPGILYRIKDFNSLVFDENGLDRLEKYEDDNIKKYAAVGAYFLDLLERPLDFVDSKEKAEEILIGIKDANYEKGLSDAWEVAKKICINPECGGLSISDIKAIYNSGNHQDVMQDFSPQEAIDKLKAWEEKQEIKVGDVVRYGRDRLLVVVTHVYKASKRFDGISADKGEGFTDRELSDCKKTGKHIDLTEIFKGLEEKGCR